MKVLHISVCICTYRRPEMLAGLLDALARQRTDGRFTHSAVVVDNDSEQSARPVFDRFDTRRLPVVYDTESTPNIAAVRNRCIALAQGDLLAFIDDDEMPGDDWLLSLFDALHEYDVDGVLGPVRAQFAVPPPDWLVKGGFYDKGDLLTGTRLGWQDTRTSNVLLRRPVLDDPANRFDTRFDKGGEDVDLFRRLMAKGHVFIWCAQAPVSESVPSERCSRRYLIRRALLRGQGTVKYASFGARDLVRSAVAVPAYTAALPFALLLGQHRFMHLLTKTAEHAARFLALAGVELVKRY